MVGGERSSWYHKLRSSKQDGPGDFTVSGSLARDFKDVGPGAGAGELKSKPALASTGKRIVKDMGSTVAGSLIENHLSSRKDLPWDQDFSSMSSCRSDLDSQQHHPGRSHGKGSEDDDLSLPPLLRNPHIAEFDIVDACSTSSMSDRGEDDEEEEEEEEAEAVRKGEAGDRVAKACRDPWPRKRRSHHNDNSFSACLPSEIKGVVADSIPLVKYSHNPYDDFRDSMLEMIREKGLNRWADLEELLFCYLSLNSPEHHEVIKQSFSDVWQDLGSSSSSPARLQD